MAETIRSSLPSSSETFLGVRFVLLGFDPVNEIKVRSKLVSGGGVDAGGQYTQNCTHVIVDKLVYDDPVCVAARNDGKILVTVLWVDHSFDVGMPLDATPIMYRPLKDFNGIPGASSLVMCLTGYQRQDRDDIMTMVGLMGAQFSKPLVANTVTHLICYKFEGEKYELAKRMKTIKLVNHRWLQDCLRDWELLPEDNYNKSGYELEMMIAEAKDSEEEAEDTTVKQSNICLANRSPQDLKIETSKPGELPKAREVPKTVQMSTSEMLRTPARAGGAGHASRSASVCVSEAPGCNSADAFRNAASDQLHDLHTSTPNFPTGNNDFQSIHRSAERSHSISKFGNTSYMRKTPRRSPSSMFSGKSGDVGGSPKAQLGNSNNSSSTKIEYAKDLFGSGHAEVPQGGSVLQFEEARSKKKQKTDVACSSSPSQRMGQHLETGIVASPSVGCKTTGLQPSPSIDGLSTMKNQSPLGNSGQLIDDIVSLNAADNSHDYTLTAKSLKSGKKPITQDLTVYENASVEAGQENTSHTVSGQTSLVGWRESYLVGKTRSEDFCLGKSDHAIAEVGEPQIQQQDGGYPSPYNQKPEGEKSHKVANLDELQGEDVNLITKPMARKKTIVNKMLGSRPKFKNAANQKGSIYLNKSAAQNDLVSDVTGSNKKAVLANFPNANELEISPATVSITTVEELRKEIVTESRNGVECQTVNVDDETEPPEENPLDVEKTEVIDMLQYKENKLKTKGGAQQVTNDSVVGMLHDAMEGTNAVDLQKDDESLLKVNGKKVKESKGKKKPFGRSNTKTVASVARKTESMRDLEMEESHKCKNVEAQATGMKKGQPWPGGQGKQTVAGKRSKRPMEVDKENKPLMDGDREISQDKGSVGRTAAKYEQTLTKTNEKARKRNPSTTEVREVARQVKTEPVCFILSGHKLQRKEFQQVIRRLKGKFCRDSHQWSYHATHFIAPDPVRRTEKFFAAVASGRWILKTDYLAACNQAGRFLAEEPYEWHKNGLTEDGAINLEAPRKWRLLRERTGHGALHGLRVIIYGECIAPPLDTLKRVVKAGKGSILATSPPYTRFLTSGVDFAIVSPGMPRVDLWVQEFLKHEIPCVVADYLVEYVCKPGYSLERHVLYNTHAWAEKSLTKLSSRAEEIVEELTSSDISSSSDIPCQVCGSHDRGEVMLLCGDERGSVGCGVGMHIDCCNPPLEDIPEEDWFCPKCSGSGTSSNPSKRGQKRSLH